MNIFVYTLPIGTKSVLDKIKTIKVLQNFYLSGGSALSLQLGHRESEDLDFFTQTVFNPIQFQQKISQFGTLKDVFIDEGTLNLFINGVKLQFLYYPYQLLENHKDWEGIKLSSVIDIACTKLITVSDRGSKKDFIDLYFILQKMSLEAVLSKLDVKYQKIEYNLPHILKSLVYFDDADMQPMPKMHIPLDWKDVKRFFIQEIKKITF